MLWQLMILVLCHCSTAVEIRSRHDAISMRYEDPCSNLREVFEYFYNIEEQTFSIALLWNNTLEHAAAALLRAMLLSVGYNQDYIELYKRNETMNTSNQFLNALSLEVPEITSPLLQIRLTPRAAYNDSCKITTHLSKNYVDPAVLSYCDFIVSKTNESVPATIYIEHKWNNTCIARFIRHTKAVSSKQFRILYVDHSYLTDIIHNFNSSFLFLDILSYQRIVSQKENSQAIPYTFVGTTGESIESMAGLNTTECILTKDKHPVLLKYATGKNSGLEVSKNTFLPSIENLQGVLFGHSLRNNQSTSNNDKMKNAGCEWIKHNFNSDSILKWRKSATLDASQYKNKLMVVICNTEYQDLKEYFYMAQLLGNHMDIDVLSYPDKQSLVGINLIDCNDNNKVITKFASLFAKIVTDTGTQRQFVSGVVVTNELAIIALPFLKDLDVPIITYDIYTGSYDSYLGSATGSVEHLVLALRRLLANCRWRRLAVISESTRLAKAVSAALRYNTTELLVRDLNITSTSDIPNVLQELLSADARVFLVNSGAATAAAVLAAAQKLNLTPDKGFTWIVREYSAADSATSTTKPYSISFWWRGDNENKMGNTYEHTDRNSNDGKSIKTQITGEVSLRLKLEKKWHGRAWPLHASPIIDALLTIIEMNKLNIRFYFYYLNSSIIIPGITQNLTYNKNSPMSPLIYVQQWGSEPRPRLLATWRGGEGRGPADVCPATDSLDGSTDCLIPSGDSFRPSCHEYIWIFSFLGVLVVIGFAVAITLWLRKAFLAYNSRIKTKYAKQILARRERVFEALAEHLVDRTELELLQELGSGRFGRVHKGVLRESRGKCRTIDIAAKALKEDASSSEESEFLKEASTLSILDHEHIIRFVGVCIVDGPPLLLMEHAFFGDLLQYLQMRRCLLEKQTNEETTNQFDTDEKTNVSPKAITKLAQEAAMALAYLTQRGIVHRDLRASNCLVDGKRCLKLADFGLARTTGTVDGEYQMCRRGVLPVLWMAPESLAKGVSSPASDVWSFGVLVFELVTLGRRPYGEQAPPAVVQHVVAGGRPQLPWDASAETRALTRACWRREPEARPSAAHLVNWLSTRWRALRPALVAELVDIDSLMNDNDVNEADLCPSKTLPSEAFSSAQPPKKLEYIAMKEIDH